MRPNMHGTVPETEITVYQRGLQELENKSIFPNLEFPRIEVFAFLL